MGLLEIRMQFDSANVFGNPDGYAEAITYITQGANGQPGVTYTLDVIVDRFEVSPAVENGNQRTRSVRFLLPRDPTGSKSPATTQLGDAVLVPWNVGEAPSRFKVVNNFTQDVAAWSIKADKSV